MYAEFRSTSISKLYICVHICPLRFGGFWWSIAPLSGPFCPSRSSPKWHSPSNPFGKALSPEPSFCSVCCACYPLFVVLLLLFII